MRKRKDSERSAPPLPKGEHYSRPDGFYRFCIDCAHYLTEIEAYEFHTRAGHRVTTKEWYDENREIARRVDATTKNTTTG